MKKDSIDRQKVVRYVVIAWVVIIITIVIYYLVTSLLRVGKIEITVKCAPYTANVYIDGVKFANNSTSYLEESEHTVTCFLNGFSIEEEQRIINVNHPNIMMALVPVTSEGEKIYEERIDDYQDLERYSGKITVDEMQLSETEKKLSAFLPYNTDNFGIGTFTEEDETMITITLWKPKYTQMAINKLVSLAKEADVSISEYGFRINNFTNQLTKINDNSETDLESYIRHGYSWLDVELRGTGEISGYEYALISVMQPSGDSVVYRALFVRKGGVPELISTPSPILTTIDNPSVSIETLDYVNNLAPSMEGNS